MNKKGYYMYLSFFCLASSFALLYLVLIFPELILISSILFCIGIIFGVSGIRHNLKTYPAYWAIPPIIGTLLNLILLIFVITTANFAFSEYDTCRKKAMNTKGYGVWEYQRTTIQESKAVFIHSVVVIFSDGTNRLSCEAVGIGPIWSTANVFQTIAGCVKDVQNGKIEMCPEDYFGVYP